MLMMFVYRVLALRMPMSTVCVVAVLMLGACQRTPADPNCKPFNFRPGGGVVIAESGRYCMRHNTRVSAVYSVLTHGNGIRITGLGGLVDDQTPVMVLSDLGNFPALYKTIIRDLPATASAYPMRNVVIEKMDVRAAYDDTIVQGAGTIIRDSVLETDAGTAIWIYGPNTFVGLKDSASMAITAQYLNLAQSQHNGRVTITVKKACV
jgi:hypothetical protein